MTTNQALDLAHDAFEGTDLEAMRWARLRLEGLLDLQARGADAKRVMTMITALTERIATV